MSGFLTFVLGGRELAAPLTQVREVVRAVGIEPLRGVRAPVTGLLALRGAPLPVVDLRTDPDPGPTGDVVVLAPDAEGAVGVAVDRVLAVLAGTDLVADEAPLPFGLPGYVTCLLRRPDVETSPVFLVDLRALAGLLEPEPPRAARRQT